MPKPKLAVTVAFDPPETGGTRQMAKMLAGSLVRNYFGGEVKVFRNSSGPLFLVFREGLEEVVVDTPALKGAQLADHARRWAPKVREMIRPEDYEWVLWLDADCLVLRDLDHLFRVDADVLVVRDAAARPGDERYAGFLTAEELEKEALRPGGRVPNVSVYPAATWAWAVRGEHSAALMTEWERVMGLSPSRPTSRVDASAWNRVLRDCGLRVKPFEDGEMRCPLTRIFDHGEVELDTNWAENSVRPLVLGRKNWLHVGSWEAGPRVAAIASVIESAKRLGLNPRDYLADVLPRLANGTTSVVPALTPAAWFRAR
ncbi:MAG: transposase [Verrucomicrobiales bacterium]|nr:transposase [Verrucomicrobiales bacterium]